MTLTTTPRILVIRTGALGDVIMTTPIIRNLYYDYNGNVEIYVTTQCPEVFKNNPYVKFVNPSFSLEFYDAIYNLNMSYEKNPGIHAIEAYTWSTLGDRELDDSYCELFPTQQDIEKIASEEFRNYIVVHNRHHTWPSRNLPPEYYADMITSILNNTDYDVVQVGSDHEVVIEGNKRLHDRLGKYSIQELEVLINHAQAFIGVDGGLLHVANCTKTPVIGFFTSCKAEYRKTLNPKQKFIPIAAKIDCYGCQEERPLATQYFCKRGDNACINTFTASEIILALNEIKNVRPN